MSCEKAALNCAPYCRIALSPFLANSTLGGHSYKWMLFGHDDTVWLLDNVIKMLGGLDPDMPYLITDNIWFGVNGSGKLSWLAVIRPLHQEL